VTLTPVVLGDAEDFLTAALTVFALVVVVVFFFAAGESDVDVDAGAFFSGICVVSCHGHSTSHCRGANVLSRGRRSRDEASLVVAFACSLGFARALDSL